MTLVFCNPTLLRITAQFDQKAVYLLLFDFFFNDLLHIYLSDFRVSPETIFTQKEHASLSLSDPNQQPTELVGGNPGIVELLIIVVRPPLERC